LACEGGELAQIKADREKKETLVSKQMLRHEKNQKDINKEVMVYGLDFGSVYERYQKESMAWANDDSKVSVVQVQPTDYGYFGKYDTAREADADEHILAISNIDKFSVVTKDGKKNKFDATDWDCHDLLKSAFELKFIAPTKTLDDDAAAVAALTDEALPQRLFVRVYSDADADADTAASSSCAGDHKIAVALSATTIFDECKEYSPWKCDRPHTTTYAYIGVTVLGLMALKLTWSTFRTKSAKTFEDE